MASATTEIANFEKKKQIQKDTIHVYCNCVIVNGACLDISFTSF